MKPPKQDRFSRYARYCYNSPCKWLAIMDMCVRHFPANIRNYACERLMLMVTEMEYGK